MGRRSIDELPDIRIRVLDLTQLIFWVNAAVDTGRYEDVTVEELSEKVDDGTILPYLEERLADAGVMQPHFKDEAAAEITTAMQSLHDTEGGGHSWAVEKNGLHAIVAWAAEMLQQGARDTTIALPWGRR